MLCKLPSLNENGIYIYTVIQSFTHSQRPTRPLRRRHRRRRRIHPHPHNARVRAPDLAKLVPKPHLINAPIPIPPLQRAQALHPDQHPRVADVVHGARDGARVDGHVGPGGEEEEGGEHDEHHDAQDRHGEPHAHGVREEGLRHAEGDVAQCHREEFREDRGEGDDGEEEVAAADGGPEAREGVRGGREEDRAVSFLGRFGEELVGA